MLLLAQFIVALNLTIWRTIKDSISLLEMMVNYILLVLKSERSLLLQSVKLDMNYMIIFVTNIVIQIVKPAFLLILVLHAKNAILKMGFLYIV